jgi:hypothetical protein
MEQLVQIFSESFKLSVVDRVNNGLISKEEARRRYGIKAKLGFCYGNLIIKNTAGVH